jgi:hypothetical protein
MSKLLKRLNLIAIYLLGGVLAGIPLTGGVGRGDAHVARAQPTNESGLKTLTVEAGDLRLSPVFITHVAVGSKQMLFLDQRSPVSKGSRIIPGVPFQAGDDWLSTIVVHLLNRANKPVARVNVMLTFTETGMGTPEEPRRACQIQLGRIPDIDAFDGRNGKQLRRDPNSRPLRLLPGQTIVVRLADHMDEIKAALEGAIPVTSVTNCDIQVAWCYFDDGMVWTGSMFATPDPVRPGKYEPLPEGFFPGDPHEFERPKP